MSNGKIRAKVPKGKRRPDPARLAELYPQPGETEEEATVYHWGLGVSLVGINDLDAVMLADGRWYEVGPDSLRFDLPLFGVAHFPSHEHEPTPPDILWPPERGFSLQTPEGKIYGPVSSVLAVRTAGAMRMVVG